MNMANIVDIGGRLMQTDELNRLRLKTVAVIGVMGVLLFGSIIFIFSSIVSSMFDPFSSFDTEAFSPFAAFIVTVIMMVITITAGSYAYRHYRIEYKNAVCRMVLEKMFDVEEFDPVKGFSKSFVQNTYLVRRGNKFSSDDYVRGKYKGYSFERSDILVQEETSDGESSSTVTYFEGNWTVFEFPKKFSNYLMLKEKGLFFTSGPSGGIFSEKPSTQRVKFESIEFNEMFATFAQDEHEAFYLLSPPLMEKIMELKKSSAGELTIGFINNKLHILFNTGENHMEPRLFTSVDENDIKRIEEEMSMVGRIVDLFRLNEN